MVPIPAATLFGCQHRKLFGEHQGAVRGCVAKPDAAAAACDGSEEPLAGTPSRQKRTPSSSTSETVLIGFSGVFACPAPASP